MSESNFFFGLSPVTGQPDLTIDLTIDDNDDDFDLVDFGLIDDEAIDLVAGDESADILAWERAEQRERE